MKIRLNYGRKGLHVEIPDKNLAGVLEMKPAEPLPDPMEAVRQALDTPISSEPLRDLAMEAKTACVVVSDKTRPVPNQIILPPILEILDAAGIDTTILIACGMHAPTEGKDLEELLGKTITGRYRVINHEGTNPASLVSIGVYRSRAEILVNRVYCDSDLKILTGFIEPHFMAGYSGGRKSVCPGIMGMESIKYAHSPEVLESPQAGAGVLHNNPLHEFVLHGAKAAGVDFIVNVTLDPNKQTTGVFAGDLEKAHEQGVAFCDQHSRATLKKPVDMVVTTNGGYPLDQDFYQTVKGMVGALSIVKAGGTVLIGAECSKGLGSDDFRKLLTEMKDPDSFIEMIQQPGYFCPDQWEVEELVKALRKATVMVFSQGITADEIRMAHCKPMASVEQGIAECLKKYGAKASIAVIPSGPYVLPGIEP